MKKLVVTSTFLVSLALLVQCSASPLFREKYSEESSPEGVSDSTGSSRGGYYKPGADSRKRATSADGKASSKGRNIDALTTDGEAPPPPKPKEKERLVIYMGELTIVVSDPESVLDKVTKATVQLGGFIEKAESSIEDRRMRIVVRVPVKDFDKALLQFAKYGDVISRNISASDVTKEFQDTSTRLKSSEKARDRLYVLLKRTASVQERVKILKEIVRLTEEIDGLVARISYLRTRADLSTITLLLQTKPAERLDLFEPSPFAWISSISPTSRTLRSTGRFTLEIPKGFFDYADDFLPGLFSEPKSDILAVAPDNTRIRVGMTENYPSGDLTFWGKALEIEMKRRGFKIVESKPNFGKQSARFMKVEIRNGLDINYYFLLVHVSGKRIHVAEAFFPTADSLKQHEASVMQSFQTLEMSDPILSWAL
ncbi:hypothetical protein CH373_05725 [Leptospira perolatii]|uniref:DUF4349 domain-containing protein n=1 Tax=Leptospira perolatii TaxID=2023191 RepID=A0A2M9ZR07_9LEPT|nr:DUF4349 domain-containing protein [Leptospira perolatii]PJZ70563.1 hypothetical protein CH360_06145 [Leptospira perolatii]PJZ74399.1 hypothetical protein CH373_05725 [Leptospira perolatii]